MGRNTNFQLACQMAGDEMSNDRTLKEHPAHAPDSEGTDQTEDLFKYPEVIGALSNTSLESDDNDQKREKSFIKGSSQII